MAEPDRDLAEIASYHAHVYFDPARTRGEAELLRAGVAERFRVRLGRWHEVKVSPHDAAMFQIAFTVELFATLVPWMMLNNRGLSILVHPNTIDPRHDHTAGALWIGERLPVHVEDFPDTVAEVEKAGEPNTEPRMTA
jgi:DOPA 4,5-dioxygenase